MMLTRQLLDRKFVFLEDLNTTEFNYDEMFRLSKITLEDSAGNFGYSPYFTYDKDNSLITAGDVQVKRNEIGQVIEKKLGKVQALYSYDEKFGELTRIEYRHNGKTISFQEFERDKLGRISTMFTETGKQVLHYDRSGRFTGRSLVGSSRPYSKFIYDKNGNRVSGHDDERTFKAEYDVHDRLTKYNNTNYYYELNGELAQVETDGELVEYFYDVFGNLTGVETPNKFIEYKVDGFNRRVSKTIRGSDVTRYIWQDQLRLAAELNGDGTLRSQFIYSDGVNSPDYMIKDGVRYYFVKDHRGSVLKVVDVGTGEVKQDLKYSEFGEVLQDTNPGFQPFGFAGGLYDHDTKLVRFGARDYDGRIGRWLSKDPIRFDGGDTNLYGYVLQDPINSIDPTGNIRSVIKFGWEFLKGWLKVDIDDALLGDYGPDTLNNNEHLEVQRMTEEIHMKELLKNREVPPLPRITPIDLINPNARHDQSMLCQG